MLNRTILLYGYNNAICNLIHTMFSIRVWSQTLYIHVMLCHEGAEKIGRRELGSLSGIVTFYAAEEFLG